MMSLKDAQHKFRLGYILRALEICGANQCAAAELIGVHRNLIHRELKAAAYASRDLVRMAGRKRIQNRVNPRPGPKPPARETAAEVNALMELTARAKRLRRPDLRSGAGLVQREHGTVAAPGE